MICPNCQGELRHYNPNTDTWDERTVINHAWIMCCEKCELIYRAYASDVAVLEDAIARAYKVATDNVEQLMPERIPEIGLGFGLLLAALEEELHLDGLAPKIQAQMSERKGTN